MRHSYNTIDLMKMIAAIFVVAIHSQPFSGLTEVLVINLFARIAVPVYRCQNIIGHVEITWMSAFIFCLIGKYIAEHESQLVRQSYSLTGLIFLLSIIEVFAVNSLNPPTTNDFYFMLVPLVTTIFILLLQHESKYNLNYKQLRIYSTIFFFSHFIFVFIFVVINKHIMPVNSLAKYGLVLVLCLITSFTIHQLSLKKKFKWLSYGY